MQVFKQFSSVKHEIPSSNTRTSNLPISERYVNTFERSHNNLINKIADICIARAVINSFSSGSNELKSFILNSARLPQLHQPLD